MSARRSLIPYAFRDTSKWPRPDCSVFDSDKKSKFELKSNAINMYATGCTFLDIKKVTGYSESEIRRLVRRCVTMADNGEIWGFYALLHGKRLAAYERKKEVTHTKGTGSAGCAGALTQLFKNHPEIEDLVRESYLGVSKNGYWGEKRMAIFHIHKRFVLELRKLNFSDYDWPFCTDNRGYQALWNWCRKFRLSNSQQAADSRSGQNAKRRGNIGKGIKPLITAMRPMTYVQLDFHKIDAASTIVITNEFGKDFFIPVSRWHIGFLVDEYSRGILGVCIALERTPSGDSTLEIIDSALRAGEADYPSSENVILDSGRILIGQLIPELKYQCFAVLKVDNAWSNTAHEVVGNIIGTVGCAVNFGPVQAWWRRSLIEKIFGEITAKGAQRMPSTHGTGSNDIRIKDPNGTAIKLGIRISDLTAIVDKVVRHHNLEQSEGRQWTSPIEIINTAISHQGSGFFYSPLPREEQNLMRLMMHQEVVVVRGSIDKNVRPHFTTDRCRYTNQILSSRFDLIGKKLKISIHRRKCRLVWATVEQSGEDLGLMHPSGIWAKSECSWRDRKFINRRGGANRFINEFQDPMDAYKNEKMIELVERKKSSKKKSSKTALHLANIQRRSNDNIEKEAYSESSKILRPSEKSAQDLYLHVDPFGLNELPPMKPLKRGS